MEHPDGHGPWMALEAPESLAGMGRLLPHMVSCIHTRCTRAGVNLGFFVDSRDSPAPMTVVNRG